MAKTLWGIDMGGTKIELAVLKSADDPEVIIRKRIPTESEQGYEHVITRIGKLVNDVAEELGHKPEIIGMGTPGIIDPESQTLKNSNTVSLNGKPFAKDLEQTLQIQMVMANDANCFAIAEANMGVVQQRLPEANTVFGVIMGTGVGGGIVVNRQVLTGRHGIAGEWGHNFLDESGGKCYCGRVGCVETMISGPASERYYAKVAGQKKQMVDIVQAHKEGTDQYATETIQHLTHFFGKAIANVINILDPDAIVLGGGLGNIEALYSEGVEAVKPYLFNHRLDTLFLKPALGDSAGVFGAAMLTVK
ncbi:ROK family protein [uncultured Microscilla sp.]|uniref:ROK family protein n=1 Tax=uncultured Microscilla sp. TaxID=432653 RepID=UPI00262C33F4|nr:ROK family protein [uncultured Microscilla sp.]